MAKLDSFTNLPGIAKVLILVVIILLLGAGYYFTLHMGLSKEIESAKQLRTSLEQQIQEAEDRERKYQQLTQELADRESKDRQLKRVLPEDMRIEALLEDLDRTRELSGLNLRLFEPRAEQTQELFSKIPVSVSVSGRFHQLAKFFYNVSHLDRIVSMENIRLTSPKVSASGEVVLEAEMLATTYRRPPDAAAPGDTPAGGAK